MPARLPEPETVAAEGAYTHPGTGMIFPNGVAGFRRTRVARVDADGSDAAVAYDYVGPTGQVAATVWVHAAPPLVTLGYSADTVTLDRARACGAELDRRAAAMEHDHVGAVPARRRSVTLVKGGRTVDGTLITSGYSARFAGRKQPVRTELAMFCYVSGAWTLEFRFSYPEAYGGEGKVAAFMGALDWGRLPG